MFSADRRKDGKDDKDGQSNEAEDTSLVLQLPKWVEYHNLNARVEVLPIRSIRISYYHHIILRSSGRILSFPFSIFNFLFSIFIPMPKYHSYDIDYQSNPSSMMKNNQPLTY